MKTDARAVKPAHWRRSPKIKIWLTLAYILAKFEDFLFLSQRQALGGYLQTGALKHSENGNSMQCSIDHKRNKIELFDLRWGREIKERSIHIFSISMQKTFLNQILGIHYNYRSLYNIHESVNSLYPNLTVADRSRRRREPVKAGLLTSFFTRWSSILRPLRNLLVFLLQR